MLHAFFARLSDGSTVLSC